MLWIIISSLQGFPQGDVEVVNIHVTFSDTWVGLPKVQVPEASSLLRHQVNCASSMCWTRQAVLFSLATRMSKSPIYSVMPARETSKCVKSKPTLPSKQAWMFTPKTGLAKMAPRWPTPLKATGDAKMETGCRVGPFPLQAEFKRTSTPS